MRKYIKSFLSFIAIITILLPVAGCSPVISREDAEKELVSLMLSWYAQRQDGQPAQIQLSDQPWLNAPSTAILITYAPPNKNKNKEPWEQLTNEPIKVWWFYDETLFEATDKDLAIQKYGENYIYGAHDWPGSFEFGILSISWNNTKATVYSGGSHCPECAGGSIHTLQRNDAGKWEVIDSELLWLS